VGAVGVAIGEGMFTVAAMTTVLIIVVLVLLRKVERAFVRRRRLFQYVFKTADPSRSLSRLFDLLDREGLRLNDFSVRDAAEGLHELRFAVITSIDQNNRLLSSLHDLGSDIQGSTAGPGD